jgi:hypothetical protein
MFSIEMMLMGRTRSDVFFHGNERNKRLSCKSVLYENKIQKNTGTNNPQGFSRLALMSPPSLNTTWTQVQLSFSKKR